MPVDLQCKDTQLDLYPRITKTPRKLCFTFTKLFMDQRQSVKGRTKHHENGNWSDTDGNHVGHVQAKGSGNEG